MVRRIFLIIITFVVSIQIIVYSSANSTKQNAIPDILALQIKSSYPACRLLQLSDSDKGLQEYLIGTPRGINPGYIAADFNGDTKEDYAVLLLCDDKNIPKILFTVFMSSKNGSYSCIDIHTWTGTLYLKNLYLDIFTPGKIREHDSRRVIPIKNHSVLLVLFESASQVYYWKDGKFNNIQISD